MFLTLALTSLNFALNSSLNISVANAAPVTIKFATVAPEGSTWVNILKEATTEIKTKTAGAVEFKLYPGGIAGDEPDVLRKMRVGQYHGGGFTGVGMGELVSEVRYLELPLYFKNMEELDFVREGLTPDYEAKFAAKGFQFLGWAEPGLVYIFSQKPVKGPDDLAGVKLWAWEGDILAEAIIKHYKLTPVNIALPDVLMALQTGMLSAVYSPPLAAMALQWNTKVKYMMNLPLTNSTGGILVAKKQWDQIAQPQQTIVKDVFKAALTKLNSMTRKQNTEAIAEFIKQGMQMSEPTQKDKDSLLQVAQAIRPEMVGKLYSADFMKKGENLVTEFRAKKKSK